MTKSILVLGAGMVGSAMALDLAKKHKVTLADLSSEALEKCRSIDNSIQIKNLDVRDKEALNASLKEHDLIICAVPGFLGFETLKAIINAGKNTVDISFFPEDNMSLDTLAKEKGVKAFVDFGVAPGMDNLILGRYNEEMKVNSFECYVGGLPLEKKWPFNYTAPFSPVDVIEEYTRPARYVENGVMVTKEALSDVEIMDFDGIGSLEAFNSDGLRSLIQTMSHIPNMIEKTLRYPGHVEYIQVLKKSGFFDTKKIEVNGSMISPLDFSTKILFDEWKLGDKKELTVMRVIIKGEQNGKDMTITYDLHDVYDEESKIASMSRTTGYTATAMANYFLENDWSENGVFPAELVGKDKGAYEFIIQYLKERGVIYNKKLS